MKGPNKNHWTIKKLLNVKRMNDKKNDTTYHMYGYFYDDPC